VEAIDIGLTEVHTLGVEIAQVGIEKFFAEFAIPFGTAEVGVLQEDGYLLTDFIEIGGLLCLRGTAGH
jgi:hypothetical protein